MKHHISLTAAVVAILGVAFCGGKLTDRLLAQTSQPTTRPVAVFFQPARNVARMADMGVGVFFGPEVENARALTRAAYDAKCLEWASAVRAVNGRSVIKASAWTAGPLPDHCVGLLLTLDEPNGKTNPSTGKPYTAADLKPEADALRQQYPTLPLYLSLAGDKVTDVKPANRDYAEKVAYYKAFGALVDVLTIDVYPKNRNAARYANTWPGDVVASLIAFTGKPVWAWIEANDQQLSPPALPDVNREPYPDDIKAQVESVMAAGVSGVGWFLTCDSGKYGWGTSVPDFLNRGDSFFPLVNRAGVSLQPQYDMVAKISRSLSGIPTTTPIPPPATLPTVDPVTQRLDTLAVRQQETNQRIDDLTAQVKALSEQVKKPRKYQEVTE